MIAHKLKMSAGSIEVSTITGVWIKDVASAMDNLASTRALKYTANTLFPEVTAYILGRNRISGLKGMGKHDVPQCDEDVRRKQEKHG